MGCAVLREVGGVVGHRRRVRCVDDLAGEDDDVAALPVAVQVQRDPRPGPQVRQPLRLGEAVDQRRRAVPEEPDRRGLRGAPRVDHGEPRDGLLGEATGHAGAELGGRVGSTPVMSNATAHPARGFRRIHAYRRAPVSGTPRRAENRDSPCWEWRFARVG